MLLRVTNGAPRREVTELVSNLVFGQCHAAARSCEDGLTPFMKSMPSVTSATWAKPRSQRQLVSARCASLNIMCSMRGIVQPFPGLRLRASGLGIERIRRLVDPTSLLAGCWQYLLQRVPFGRSFGSVAIMPLPHGPALCGNLGDGLIRKMAYRDRCKRWTECYEQR